jgi:hypothetical protein
MSGLSEQRSPISYGKQSYLSSLALVKFDGFSTLHKFGYGLLRVENSRGMVVGTACHNNVRSVEYVTTKFSYSTF